jgi:hypothetical protein
MPLALTFALRIALCAAVCGLAWWLLGPAAALLSLALLGVLLAKPLIELTSASVGRVRDAALQDLEGHHYAHAGFPLEVIETPDARWLRAAPVQRLLGDTAPEASFARRMGPGEQLEPRPGRWYVRDEALASYLDRSPQAMDKRRNGLRLFIQREIIDPHRRARRRQGG